MTQAVRHYITNSTLLLLTLWHAATYDKNACKFSTDQGFVVGAIIDSTKCCNTPTACPSNNMTCNMKRIQHWFITRNDIKCLSTVTELYLGEVDPCMAVFGWPTTVAIRTSLNQRMVTPICSPDWPGQCMVEWHVRLKLQFSYLSVDSHGAVSRHCILGKLLRQMLYF